MKNVFLLVSYLLAIMVKLIRPGGTKALITENLLLKQQLLILNRGNSRSPRLSCWDRLILAFCTSFISPSRISKVAVVVKPATLLRFHKALVQRKYRRLFGSTAFKKPGPKGPSPELVAAIIDLKQMNPRMGCPQIAAQLSHSFGIDIDKDVVRRVLDKHFKPFPSTNGPSWLTFLAQMKDSLWSVDFFHAESINLRTYVVMVVMDIFTRRIIGFAVRPYPISGPNACAMFNLATSRQKKPKFLSSDNDPLYRFHRWLINLELMDITEIKTVPYTPVSHPFVERLIGTIRREHLDHTLFWNQYDLQRKLDSFKDYYNQHRVHISLEHQTPYEKSEICTNQFSELTNFKLKSHCNGLFHTPIQA
jgi:putative transposase